MVNTNITISNAPPVLRVTIQTFSTVAIGRTRKESLILITTSNYLIVTEVLCITRGI
jgi:hypothetical protein